MPQTVERYARQLVSQYEFSPFKLDGFFQILHGNNPGSYRVEIRLKWMQWHVDVSETIRL
jgi:hypothetical protein